MTTYLHRIIDADDPLVSPYAEDDAMRWLDYVTPDEDIESVDDEDWLPTLHLLPHAR